MGEIADMMLDGTLCEACGELIADVENTNWKPQGFPGYCSEQCARDRGIEPDDFDVMVKPEKVLPGPDPRHGLPWHDIEGRIAWCKKYRPNKTVCPLCGKMVKIRGDGLNCHKNAKHPPEKEKI